MIFQTSVISNKGGRKVNEDYADFLLTEGGGCWVVADGLGGHRAGDIASKLAAQIFLSHLKQKMDTSSNYLKVGMEYVQHALLKEQKQHTTFSSMRTTMVSLVCNGTKANWIHVGDSRLYHFRNGKIIAQTKDHSVCQALVNTGELTKEQIRFHEDRNRLYRVLGTDGNVKAALLKEEVLLEKGDAFLLCTDGFWEYVIEEEMENLLIISGSPEIWLNRMLSLHRNRVEEAHDNYSAIAVFCEK